MTELTFSGDGSLNSSNNIKNLVLKIFIAYSLTSLVIFVMLNLSDVRLFNSLNLTMTLVSTGGFIPSDSLNRIISSNVQKIVFIFSLLTSMLNLFLVFNIFKKNILFRQHQEDLYIIFLTIFLILLVFFNDYNSLDIIISVLSSLSNSGLSLIKADHNLSLYFLFITLIGGSLISCTSGIKMTRIFILLKTTSIEILRLISPNSIINKNIFNSEKKITDESIKISFLIFISFFISLFILSGILIFDNIDFEKSFKLSLLTITNTTYSDMFGISKMNFANLLTSSKLSLIIFMIIGKIELISIFLIIKKIFFKD